MSSFLSKHLYVIGIIYAITAIILFPKWTVDDAYISIRYADNLAKYGELTWNPGEDPIEGYTGIALPLILAFFIKLGISPILVGKIIGVTAFFIGGCVLHALLKLIKVEDKAVLAALLMYYTAPFMFVHSLSGLETMLFSAAILLSLHLFLINLLFTKKHKLTETVFILTLFATSLIRPEGVIVSTCLLTALGIINFKSDRRKFWRYVLKVLAFFILPGLIYFVWRWQYYGQILPNTFYAKGGVSLINKWSVFSLVKFGLLFLSLPAVVVLLLNLPGFRVVRDSKWDHPKRLSARQFTAAVSVIVFAVIVLARYMQSRLLMNFEFRFFVPFFPLYLIYFAILLDWGLLNLRSLKADKRILRKVLTVIIVLLTSVQAIIYLREYKKYRFVKSTYKNLIESEHIPAGLYVKEHIPEDEWLAVIHDVGAPPYYARRKTVDFSRLNNEDLTDTKLTEKDIIDYFFSFNPGAAIVTSYKWEELYQPWIYGEEAKMISEDPRFANYTLVKKFRADQHPLYPVNNYFEFVYLRNDLLETGEGLED